MEKLWISLFPALHSSLTSIDRVAGGKFFLLLMLCSVFLSHTRTHAPSSSTKSAVFFVCIKVDVSCTRIYSIKTDSLSDEDKWSLSKLITCQTETRLDTSSIMMCTLYNMQRKDHRLVNTYISEQISLQDTRAASRHKRETIWRKIKVRLLLLFFYTIS